MRSEPACPACQSPELRHEIADRWQCQNCGYLVIVSDDGAVRPWLAWMTAGRRRRASRPGRPAGGHGDRGAIF